MEYLVIFALSLFIGIILFICFVKEINMTHFVLFILSGVTVIISNFCFLIFKFGLIGAITTIIQTVCDFVVIAVILYILCLVLELIDFFYKKIKNFVKKLLTRNKI